ncbi:MAG: UDP-N-acetylmuramate--L-alanine ligase [Isosphaeraceae bacterium]
MPEDRSRQVGAKAGAEAPHAHVLGIDGQGMAGLAQSLLQRGMAVTGSEEGRNPSLSRLQRGGLPVRRASLPHAFSRRTRLLLHGPEILREHSARLGALRRGIRQATPSAWLHERMEGKTGLAIAGGREASVAAAMTGLILLKAGMDPSVFLERPATQLGGWARRGAGPHMVAEWAGEADGFRALSPALALLLNVGCDPWTDRECWASALKRFLEAVPETSHVLALGHPSLLQGNSLPGTTLTRFEWISLQRGASWWGTDLRQESERFRFRIFHEGRYVIEVRLQVRGRRNVVGALAAAAACDRLGIPRATILEGLEDFRGVARDFEDVGTFRGVRLVDEEADDARSIHEALTTARKVFGRRRIWAVCGPPGVASSPAELRRLLDAYSLADHVLILQGPRTEPGTSPSVCLSRTLTHALDDAGRKSRLVASLAEAISVLDRSLEPGDVWLLLGGGDVGTIADAFIRRLPRDRQAG